VLQRGYWPAGFKSCGAILWETKRTKNWTDSCSPNLEPTSVRLARILAILVSACFRRKSTPSGPLEGSGSRTFVSSSRWLWALRNGLIEVASAKQIQERPGDKDGAGLPIFDRALSSSIGFEA